MDGALEGVTVIDITEGIAGPQCSRHLGDAGATVVKVEPLDGDVARGWGPPFVGDDSAVFVELNANKQSLACDMTGERGRTLLRRLLADADIFMHDRTPSHASAMGIEDERLRRANPKLISCVLTPFSDDGPYRNWEGSELTVQAMSDYIRTLGEFPDHPARLGFETAQMNCGVFAFQALMAALFQRSRTGLGQRVATSWFGSLVHMHGLTWAAFTNPDFWGGQHHDLYTDPPRHGYACRDGEVLFTLGRISEGEWSGLVAELGIEDAVRDDPRFADQGRETVGVGDYARDLRHVWERAFAGRPRAEVLSLLQSVGANAVPVNSYEDVLAEEQLEAVALVHEVDHPTAGHIRTFGAPWKLSDTPCRAPTAAPRLGANSREVLQQFGLEPAEIDDLIDDGIVAV